MIAALLYLENQKPGQPMPRAPIGAQLMKPKKETGCRWRAADSAREDIIVKFVRIGITQINMPEN